MRILIKVGIPKLYWYGKQGEYNAMVIELLGPNLEHLLKYCNKQFSLVTTVMLAEQMIDLVEHLHNHSFVHRDIKPENFVIGKGENSNSLYMIDLGLAKRYRDPKSKLHGPYRDNRGLTGTARYSSINTHLGVDQTRRDDIESLAYVFIYLLKGTLPWKGIRATCKQDKYNRIMDTKMTTPVDYLCRDLPSISQQFTE